MNFLPLPENISSFGGELDSLTYLITYITAAAFIIAEFALFYFIFRFRKKKSEKASYIPGNNWKQLRWIFIPLIFVVALDLFIDEKNTHAWNRIKREIPNAESYTLVEITGQQFSWLFNYPGQDGLLGTVDDFSMTNELHIPAHEKVVFYLKSRDVLHSFFVPTMRFKQDAIPGRTIKGWFDAEKPGKYEIACAEICGAGHGVMQASLIVHEPKDYQNWLAEQNSKVEMPLPGELPRDKELVQPSEPPSNEHGGHGNEHAASTDSHDLDAKQILQAKGCLGCHSLDGSKVVGPSYQGIMGRQQTVLKDGQEQEIQVDEDYLRRSITEPSSEIVKGYPDVMPKTSLSADELDAIVSFLKEI